MISVTPKTMLGKSVLIFIVIASMLYVSHNRDVDKKSDATYLQTLLDDLKNAGPVTKVTLDGKKGDASRVLKALYGTQCQAAHHSRPTTELCVDVIGTTNTLHLLVMRDSARANDYWVYWKNGNRLIGTTSDGEVFSEALKHIKTD